MAALLAGCGPAAAAPVDHAAAATAPASSALVWGLHHPDRAARRLRRHAEVVDATVVGRGVVLLRRSRAGGRTVQKVGAGYAIPLDTIAVDPRRYARTVPADAGAFARLRRGRAVISRTEAQLRGAGMGAVFDLADGRRVRVIGVVDDAVLRDAELAVPAGDPRMPPLRSTVAVGLRGPVTKVRLIRWAQRGAAAKLLPDGPGDVGPVRPATLKGAFGEPAVGLPYGSDWIRLSPAFVHRHIVSRRVPILGTVSCHRRMIPHLRAAMAELVHRGLAHTVNPGDYAGCFAPRRIQPRGQLSLHAWGLAVDLNASRNPFRGASHQDPRLVRVMEKHGFTWGGRWPTRPDPMHFEYRGSGAPTG